MTVPEFFAWWDAQEDDGRFELVDGEVVAMVRDRISGNIELAPPGLRVPAAEFLGKEAA